MKDKRSTICQRITQASRANELCIQIIMKFLGDLWKIGIEKCYMSYQVRTNLVENIQSSGLFYHMLKTEDVTSN